MLAVAVSAHAFTADLEIEVTLSPRLRTPPLPVTPAGVADRWRNIGSCRKTSLHNALQVEKMLRVARNGEKNNDLHGDRCSVVWRSGRRRERLNPSSTSKRYLPYGLMCSYRAGESRAMSSSFT